MVTAIRKFPYMRPMGGSTELRGFLCIDSESENTFSNDRYYVCVVNLLSDSLYEPTLKSGIFEIQSDLYGYSG